MGRLGAGCRWRSDCFIATLALARLCRASGANISPGPYRSFRELSLAGSVDPDIWCPPTFVGNSGIERFNGVCGFALFMFTFVRVSPLTFKGFIARIVHGRRRKRRMPTTKSKAEFRAIALAARDRMSE